MFNAMTAQVAEALSGPAAELNARIDAIAAGVDRTNQLLEAVLAVEYAKLTSAQKATLGDTAESFKAVGIVPS